MGLKLSELDGIVFDMDGVIFDSEVIGLESWERLGKKYGLTNVHENAMKCIGRSTVDTMAILEAAYGDKVSIPELYDEAKAICADIIAERGLPLKSGARELLSYLKERDIKVGLASSTSYKGVIKNLKGAGLLDYFHVIIGGDMIKHSKPQPEIYLLACKKLGVRPEKTVAVDQKDNAENSNNHFTGSYDHPHFCCLGHCFLQCGTVPQKFHHIHHGNAENAGKHIGNIGAPVIPDVLHCQFSKHSFTHRSHRLS